jgi:N-glycosylase/DNA lyase
VSRTDPPTATWYRVLDRFGLPTLFALALLWQMFGTARADREERTVLLEKLTQAVQAQTSAMQEVARAEREHVDAVRVAFSSSPQSSATLARKGNP